MSWHASLDLAYAVEAGRTVARHRHTGPLRILQSLYPEGDTVCHNVLVHPPGGLVGGDSLEIVISAQNGAHGLVTTPGATRFYRSEGAPALQHTRIRLAPGARLEWLPLEAICYSGCLAKNRLDMDLAPGAELLGWDLTALGLPAASQPFAAGSLLQHIELTGHWREYGRIAAADTRLMDGPLGLAGQRCIASIFVCTGHVLERPRVQELLDSARAVIELHAPDALAGATSPNDHVVLVRMLSPMVEPAMGLLRQIRDEWRRVMWQTKAQEPRIWST
ncbi:MAG: urease accessory protein UreD [Rhodoferax sp.]|nr:urease accessory protein UreD [Rhodoferax sp.]MBP9928319.1 urease accessory protein UreD [Rhodoferax sp.]HQZ05997.1 urease accessory protein UreD [Burkholderiaceae bacterium]HRA61348.1 urease accessory protein UreD [Burkholderiaceae bacterium]